MDLFQRISLKPLHSLIAALLLLFPSLARADTYQIFDLGSTSPFSEIYGLDNSGTVVLQLALSCPLPGVPSCYGVWSDGAIQSYSLTIPALTYDNRGTCNNQPIDLGFPFSVCNNGRAAISGKTYGYGLWVGPDPLYGPAPFSDLTRIFDQPVYLIDMNASGDVAFSTGFENYLAYNVSADTPEPASWILLGTGMLAGVRAMRRRWA